jgi:hypothetical protein
MKRSTSLALAALLLAASAVATDARQNRAVLAAGDPPLTRAMVAEVAGFFEWLFEARMTAAERGRLESLLVEVWRRDARAEIKSVVEFGELNAKLLAATAAQREEVRGAMLPKVLESLRAEPDEFSRLMLGVYAGALAAHGEATDEGATAQTGGAVAELFGSWRTSQISMLVYQNQVTGSATPGSGTTMQYRFHPDGRFEYNGYLQSTVYNCTTTLFNPMAGTYRVDGSRLTLTPRTNLWRMTNNCAPGSNKESAGKMDVVVYQLGFKQENGRQFLCLTGPDGKGACYQKE